MQVLKDNIVLIKLLEKRLQERMAVIAHIIGQMKVALKEITKLRSRISSLKANGVQCNSCGRISSFNLNSSGTVNFFMISNLI